MCLGACRSGKYLYLQMGGGGYEVYKMLFLLKSKTSSQRHVCHEFGSSDGVAIGEEVVEILRGR